MHLKVICDPALFYNELGVLERLKLVTFESDENTFAKKDDKYSHLSLKLQSWH